MDFIPVSIDGGVVLNAAKICHYRGNDCKVCTDVSVGIHNWLVTTGLKYLIIDFQDEKEVCEYALTELLQLKKRTNIPFVFVGLMDRPQELLQSYAYRDHPFFVAPEDAIDYLKGKGNVNLEDKAKGIDFDQPISFTRSRINQRDTDTEHEHHDDEEDDLEI